MASEDNKEYGSVMLTILILGWAILFFHLYVFCYGSLELLGINLSILETFIRSINKGTGIFDTVYAAKLAAILPLLVYCLGNKHRKKLERTWGHVLKALAIGIFLYFGSTLLLYLPLLGSPASGVVYSLLSIIGYMYLIKAGSYAGQIISMNQDNDPFNLLNQSFQQEERLLDNEYSVNIETNYNLKGKKRKGYINIINPFRASMVLGTPGSGKSFAVVNQYIRQHIEKDFAMYIYDYKFPDLSTIAFHYLKQNAPLFIAAGKVVPQFVVINFDDPARSNRCNPLLPSLMTDIADASESAQTILLNLNKTWIQKQGDFFVESPITFVAAIIWYLKLADDRLQANLQRLAEMKAQIGRHQSEPICLCTLPHIIEFISRDYEEIFPMLMAQPEIISLMTPFASAFRNKALEQLEGQIASARIPLSRLASPALYWVMTGNDFTLDINDPQKPKILCVGNNPDRQSIYGAALGLYNARLVKIVNRKGRQKTSIIIDELPTIYFKGLDNLIATGRSNKISTLLGLQDLSQMKRDYGDKEATSIFNTTGNVFSGAVIGETAKTLSSRFGKNVQSNQSINISEKETTTNVSTRLESVIPESVISTLSQGEFVGTLSDNIDQEMSQKIFHAKIIVPTEMVSQMNNLEPIPANPTFEGISQKDKEAIVSENFYLIRKEVAQMIAYELAEIRNHPDATIKKLLNKLKTKEADYLTRDEEEDNA